MVFDNDEKYLVNQPEKSMGEIRDFKEELFAGFAHDYVNLLMKRYIETGRLRAGFKYKGSVAIDKKMFSVIVTVTAAELNNGPQKHAKVIRILEQGLRLLNDDKRACTKISEEIQDGLDEFVDQLPIV